MDFAREGVSIGVASLTLLFALPWAILSFIKNRRDGYQSLSTSDEDMQSDIDEEIEPTFLEIALFWINLAQIPCIVAVIATSSAFNPLDSISSSIWLATWVRSCSNV